MAWSGRFVLLVALGIVPIILLNQPDLLGIWLLFAMLVAMLDLLLAGSPRQLRLERELPERVRLGETVASALLLTNVGRRTIRGIVRDGWQPSAGASPTRARLVLPVGERRRIETSLTPFRRGERRAAEVTVRSFGPLGLLARQATLAATPQA